MKNILLILIVSFAFFHTVPVDAIDVQVRIKSQKTIENISISMSNLKRNQIQSKFDSGKKVFKASLNLKELNGRKWFFPTKIMIEGKNEEYPLFLEYKLNQNDVSSEFIINLTNDSSFDLPEVDRLDSIYSAYDDDSHNLEVYFASRYVFQRWVDVSKGKFPYQRVAIRAAKLWFDSSYRLARDSSQIFEMDKQATRMMEKYEKSHDSAPWYNEIVKPGYIDGMIAEIIAFPFQDAAQVKDLIDNKQFSAAIRLINELKNRFEKLSIDQKAIVISKAGVDLKVLEDNLKYINTLMDFR
jgi:hypothetical protein